MPLIEGAANTFKDQMEVFIRAAAITNDVSDKEYGVVVKDFIQTTAPQRARYVPVKAYNYGKIPEWHPGKGGEAWIFVDEIIIE